MVSGVTKSWIIPLTNCTYSWSSSIGMTIYKLLENVNSLFALLQLAVYEIEVFFAFLEIVAEHFFVLLPRKKNVVIPDLVVALVTVHFQSVLLPLYFAKKRLLPFVHVVYIKLRLSVSVFHLLH